MKVDHKILRTTPTQDHQAAQAEQGHGRRLGDGNVYVADHGGQTISRFNGKTGAYMNEFITPGFRPWGLAFGPDGNLYVSRDADTIKCYQGPAGSEPGALIGDYTPADALHNGRGIAFGPNGDLYVADEQGGASRQGNIKKFAGPRGEKPGTLLGVIDRDDTAMGGVQNVAFLPNGNLLVSSSREHPVEFSSGETWLGPLTVSAGKHQGLLMVQHP